MTTGYARKGGVNSAVGQSYDPRAHAEDRKGYIGVVVKGWKVEGKVLGLPSGSEPAFQSV